MSATVAEVISKNTLNFYKYPKYQVSLSLTLIPTISFARINRLASFKIISEELFPADYDYSRIFYLRSYGLNFKAGSITLQLIDKDFY